MAKKSLFHLLLIIGLLTLMVGCGGGGGNDDKDDPNKDTNDNTNNVTYSKDYFGLEVGYKKIYSYKSPDSDYQRTDKVVSEDPGEPGLFKTEWFDQNDVSMNKGFYYRKVGNIYYDSGYWDIEDDEPSIPTDSEKILENPITSSYPSEAWGDCKGQETITVAAGTFDAWKFIDDMEPDELGEEEDITYWFVPYLGYIKVIEVEKVNGTETSVATTELISASY